MKKGKVKNVKEDNFGFYLTVIISLIIIFFLVFVIIRPFGGEITENNPIMRVLCTMQMACDYGVSSQICMVEGTDFVNKKLLRSKNYHGCNESTKGYIYDKKYHYVQLESCGCNALQ